MGLYEDKVEAEDDNPVYVSVKHSFLTGHEL